MKYIFCSPKTLHGRVAIAIKTQKRKEKNKSYGFP